MPSETRRPRASVVITAYNDLRFLDEAVDSILRQDFRDFELVLVDDGTGEAGMFEAIERRDPRIRLVVNPTNLGGAAAANRGIEVARSDIIVRLDADDVAEPTRVGRLVAALDEDPQLGLVGSSVTLIDESGRPQGVIPMPQTDLEIRWTILFYNPFFHPTVAFRRECFEKAGRYLVEQAVSYDHYMWFHMLPFCRARNLPEPLTRYRMNSRGLTATHSKNPRNRTHRIRESLWADLGLTYDLYDDDLAADLAALVSGANIAAVERRPKAYRTLLTVLRRFLETPRPLAQPGDAERERQLARSVVARLLGNPPSGRREVLATWVLCWRLDRPAAMEAARSWLFGHTGVRRGSSAEGAS